MDTIALIASLEIFNSTSMAAIRRKSVFLTGYLEHLLLQMRSRPFEIITSLSPSERGAQLSLRFKKDILDSLMPRLRMKGIVVAQKREVIRIAPVPMYNTFIEVWDFVSELQRAIAACEDRSSHGEGI